MAGPPQTSYSLSDPRCCLCPSDVKGSVSPPCPPLCSPRVEQNPAGLALGAKDLFWNGWDGAFQNHPEQQSITLYAVLLDTQSTEG